MARRTREAIEQALLHGESVSWTNKDSGGVQALSLAEPEQRRLFAFLLNSSIRDTKLLDNQFIYDLRAAYTADTDPANSQHSDKATSTASRRWVLWEIQTEDFGGINLHGGKSFVLPVTGNSICFEGPNGSGKSSLIGAISWALTSHKIREHQDSDIDPTRSAPVLDDDGKKVGHWPPIAAYPDEPTALSTHPTVSVKLTFKDELSGEVAHVERRLAAGVLHFDCDAVLDLPPMLLQVGLLMPLRLQQFRFGEKGGQLADAVQALTGLDKLKDIGDFVGDLCNRTKEYLRYARTQKRDDHKKAFFDALQSARMWLAKASIPTDGIDDIDAAVRTESPIGALKAKMEAKAAECLGVTREDLHPDIDLKDIRRQKETAAAVTIARNEVAAGLDAIKAWETLSSLACALPIEARVTLTSKIAEVTENLSRALDIHARQQVDNKYRLKAFAASWHASHHENETHISDCPLCTQSLNEQRELAAELTSLREASEAAHRTLDDACREALETLVGPVATALPIPLDAVNAIQPRADVLAGLRSRFVTGPRYASILSGIAAAVETSIASTNLPEFEEVIEPIGDEPLPVKRVRTTIRQVQRAVALAEWFECNSAEFEAFWASLAGQTDESSPSAHDSLNARLERLAAAIADAEPYREGAAALGTAISAAIRWHEINQEQSFREKIAHTIEPLKHLRLLVEADAKKAIDDLSTRIQEILSTIYMVERLRYHGARFEKSSVNIEGGFTEGIRIDATLVANSSWLRAISWAFIFALRAETLEELGYNPFPLLLLDDPQATFDVTHRYKWGEYIATLTNLAPDSLHKAQTIITSYDVNFIDVLFSQHHLSARCAKIEKVGSEIGTIAVIDGDLLTREWIGADKKRTPEAGRAFLEKVRVHTEAMLKLMLRGEDPAIPNFNLGELRDRLEQLGTSGTPPYNRPAFRTLTNALEKNRKEIINIQKAHHSKDDLLGYPQAAEVEKFWRRELEPALARCFGIAREFRQLNGDARALFAGEPRAALPEGYKDAVRGIPLTVYGRAAALSGGRVADGMIEFSLYDETTRERVTLHNHHAYRLTANTLDPVAVPGDLLLVRNDVVPTPKSLVAGIVEERLVARRLELAEQHPELAVLTAQSVNPREIFAPIVAHRTSVTLKKIVGVLFDRRHFPSFHKSGDEVCAVSGTAEISRVTRDLLGLVEIVGESAEPYVLDKQYLIIGKPMLLEPDITSISAFDGEMVIAVDERQQRYFKRLRWLPPSTIILESLDISGRHGPVVLSTAPNLDGIKIKELVPVAGVLFERP
jgi:hypothetical protein